MRAPSARLVLTKAITIGVVSVTLAFATLAVQVSHRVSASADTARSETQKILSRALVRIEVLAGAIEGMRDIQPDEFEVASAGLFHGDPIIRTVMLASPSGSGLTRPPMDPGEADGSATMLIDQIQPPDPKLRPLLGRPADMLGRFGDRSESERRTALVSVERLSASVSEGGEHLLVRRVLRTTADAADAGVRAPAEVDRSRVRAELLALISLQQVGRGVGTPSWASLRLGYSGHHGPELHRGVSVARGIETPFLVEGLPVRGDFSASALPTWRESLMSAGVALGGSLAVSVLLSAIGDRRRQMAALSHRLQIANSGARIGIWEYTPSSGRLVWDRVMYDLYDVDPDSDVDYLRWADTLHPEDREAVIQNLEAALAGEERYDTQFRIETRDHRVRHIRAVATIIRDDLGHPEVMIGANWDITRTETALEVMSESQRVARLGSWSYQLGSAAFSWSGQMYELFGRDPGLGAPGFDEVIELYADDDGAALQKEIRKSVEGGTPYSLQLRTREGHGGVRYVRNSGRIRRDHKGSIVGLYGTVIDVTDTVEREIFLKEITATLDATTDCVYIYDPESMRIVYANRGATELLGWDEQELLGMGPAAINLDRDERSVREAFTELRHLPDLSNRYRTTLLTKQGGGVHVEETLQFVPQIGSGGRCIAIVRDISAQLAYERRLCMEMEAASAANRAKSAFLAHMSHEIRTPMTAILGYADLLQDDSEFVTDTARKDEALETIRDNAHHLLCVVNDILDVSKIEAGQMTIERIETDPCRLIEEVVRVMTPRVRGRAVELRTEYATRMPVYISTDPTRLRQVLINLIGNAVKFTQEGSVTVRAGCDPDRSEMTVEVIDTGIGMSDEQRERVARFEAFVQADSSMARRFGGTGLGLRISHALADMLGGDLGIESALGSGTTMTLTIDTGRLGDQQLRVPKAASRPARPAPSTASGTPLRGVRVLLAEDGPDNRRLITLHLERAGAAVTVVENGAEAVRCLKRGRAENPDPPFDLVLMDMQMPEMDGYEATSRARAAGITLPIIAITAHAMEGDREKCLRAGCDDYLTKPISRVRLVECCVEAVSPEKSSRAA